MVVGSMGFSFGRQNQGNTLAAIIVNIDTFQALVTFVEVYMSLPLDGLILAAHLA